ncbi:class I SAM-dependent methyltransferase [Polycladidibacter hongkongensis]|uniref:class I SAM-dependent methyltransferase n=1 Tax=Polycladidibacter hongkongensis TaxID=1647556 RepID=UPI00082FB553|nr:class I SAM-dependent methyltransferase [Pseudovibrio hongkongensis]
MSPSPLLQKIKSQISLHGPMSIARYMELCLSDPDHGYYTTRDPFGAQGDFITAPEVSQLFGELCGAWLLQRWLEDGCPKNCVIAEIGPGRGTLMRDMLRVFALRPQFMQASTLHLVETSPSLRKIQAKKLRPFSIKWHDSIHTLPDGPLYLIANELFDALPIQQFQWANNKWYERAIGLDDDGNLAFGLAAATLSPDQTGLPIGTIPHAGDILELSAASTALIRTLAERIKSDGGSALLIDYGYTTTTCGDTFQALKAHQAISPLEQPGDADLTAHVNFESLANTAKAQGIHTFGPITQAELLLGLGLLERAGQLGTGKSANEQESIRKAVERLAADNEMGTLFKALAISQNPKCPPAF